MSSGFVSGGTSEQPRERNELWQKAEQELEAARQRKLEQKNHDGKSLYEVLQENKAAKQEAFEESIKLKHQFRSLDEDDVAFLNSIHESEMEKERATQQETSNQLEAFRKQQQGQSASEQTDDQSLDPTPKQPEDLPSWQVIAKKRKREQGTILKGVKVARTVSAVDDAPQKDRANDNPRTSAAPDLEDQKSSFGDNTANLASSDVPDIEKSVKIPTTETGKSSSTLGDGPRSASKPPAPALGLGGYDSDSDE